MNGRPNIAYRKTSQFCSTLLMEIGLGVVNK